MNETPLAYLGFVFYQRKLFVLWTCRWRCIW